MTVIDSGGAITVDDGGVFGPDLTLPHFLASAPDHAPVISNGLFSSWRITRRIGAADFALVLRFRGERLVAVDMVLSSPEFSTGWSEWSEEREVMRKRAHDRWLRDVACLGPGRYPWGAIDSAYDSKSGGSYITVAYEPRREPSTPL